MFGFRRRWHYVILACGTSGGPFAAGRRLQTLQQPLTDLAGECKLPISIPQVLGIMSNTQHGGGLPGGLPGSLQGAQTALVPGTALPAQSSPASAIIGGTGPLPGPLSVATR